MLEELDTLTIPAALARAASRFGGRDAYTEGSRRSGRALTWAALSQRSAATAAGLIELGLETGDRVAICAENSLDWIVTFHATVAAGASAVLVSPDLKPDEICEQVRRPGSRFLFASENVLRKLGSAMPPIERVIVLGPKPEASLSDRTLDEVAKAAAAAGDLPVSCRPSPDDLAAIIYTSGTTGGPKGVMLSHRNLLSGAASAIQALGLTSRDSALLVLPLHHSLSFMIATILPALLGGNIILESNLRRIPERLQEHRPTVFFGVPALFETMYMGILARAESEGSLARMRTWQSRVRLVKHLTGLNIGPLVFRQVHRALGGRIRFLVSGAAPLKPQTALDFYSLGLPLIQGCGVTEAVSAVAVQRFSRRRFLLTRYYERHLGSVGSALPGVELRLADVPEKDIRVETDGQGELLVRGPNVCLGYWQAPEATKAAMVHDWFRTGDLARIDKDGNVYLTGRSKFIIVLDSGEKVYPDEVEAKLEESELVEDVCVTGRRIRDETIVTAVIYPKVETVLACAHESGSQPDEGLVQRLIAEDVEKRCRALVPYKRVARIELTSQPLPKTAVRKIARGRLADSYDFDYAQWTASAASAEQVDALR